MRAGTTEIEALNGRLVLRPAGNWTHEEKLLQRQIPVKNVSFGQSIHTLEIQGRKHLPCDDCAGHVWCIFCDLRYYTVAEQFAVLIPCFVSQKIRNVLNEAGHDVPAPWSKSIVNVGSDHAIHPKLLRDLAEFRDVVTALRKLERW